MSYKPANFHAPLATRTFTVRESDVREHCIVSPHDSRLATFGIACWIASLNDSPVPSTDESARRRDVLKFYKLILARPLSELVSVCSSMADGLLANLTIEPDGSTTGPFDERFRKFPILREYLVFRRTKNSTVLGFITQFLWFLKKLRIRDKSFDATALRGWLQCEKRLGEINPDPDDLRGMRNILAALLPEPDLSEFQPKHGPGNVAEKGVKDVVVKSSAMTYDKKIDNVFFLYKQLPLGSYVPDTSYWEECRQAPLSAISTARVSRLKFVPKDLRKSRSICMEPMTLMYFQQGIMNMLVSAISRSLYSNIVDLEDQEANRDLARYGSIFGSHDTLDCSNASDLVSWDVVKAIFPSSWLMYFASTRSTLVDIGSETVRVKKFAPMGSALCFPVECLVFSTAVILVLLRSIGVDPTVATASQIRSSLKNHLSGEFWRSGHEVRVYGDDIITTKEISNDVITLLQSLGHEVNESKSFFGKQSFRESCGGFYYEGDDITPSLFRIKPFDKGGVWGADSYASAVAAANNFGDRNYPSVRQVIIHALRDIPKVGGGKLVVPFTARRDVFGIFTTHVHPCKTKRNRYHYEAVKANVVKSTIVRAKNDLTRYELWSISHYSYNQYWYAIAGNTRYDDFEWSSVFPVRGRASLAWGWIPIE